MKEDNKPTEVTAPEPVVINPGGSDDDITKVKPEVKKAVLETPALPTDPATKPVVESEPEASSAPKTPDAQEPKTTATQEPVKIEPQKTPASPAASPAVVAPTTTETSNSSVTPKSVKKPKKFMQKSFLLSVLLGFFLVGGGAAAYLTVFQKSPEDIWNSALKNTAEGLDDFIELSKTQNKGVKLSGSMDISEPVDVKGSLEGQADKEGNSAFEMDLSTSGFKLDAEVRSIKNDSEIPDFYFKLKGLESFTPLLTLYTGDQSGLIASMVAGINDQWYVVDDSLLSGLGGAEVDTSTMSTDFSEEELREAGEAVANVVKDRLLSADEEKAVFVLDEKLGKEKFENTDTYKFKVKVSKEKLKDFVVALDESIKGTIIEELFDASKASGELDSALDVEEMLKGIDESNIDDVYAHVWAEDSGGFIRNIRIYPFESGEGSDYMDFSLDYQGGDVFPFEFKVSRDSKDSSGTFSLGIEINQKNADSKIWFDLDIGTEGDKVAGEGSLTINTSDEDFSVEAPADAKSATELLSLFLGGSSLTTPSSTLYDSSLYPDYPSLYDGYEL